MSVAMNQSLSPTKLETVQQMSPSHYPDKRSYVAAYKRMVSFVDARRLWGGVWRRQSTRVSVYIANAGFCHAAVAPRDFEASYK